MKNLWIFLCVVTGLVVSTVNVHTKNMKKVISRVTMINNSYAKAYQFLDYVKGDYQKDFGCCVDLIKKFEFFKKDNYKQLKRSYRFIKKRLKKKLYKNDQFMQKSFDKISKLYDAINNSLDMFHAQPMFNSMQQFYASYDVRNEQLFNQIEQFPGHFKIKNLYDLSKKIKKDKYQIIYMIHNFKLSNQLATKLVLLNQRLMHLQYLLYKNVSFKSQQLKVRLLKAFGVISFICLPLVSIPLTVFVGGTAALGIYIKKEIEYSDTIIPALHNSWFASFASIYALVYWRNIRAMTYYHYVDVQGIPVRFVY